ncbi:zinc-binding alcohol dehydrogenase family protein [Nocardia sp. NPDC056100]|uniref:quinone oxidoreductase family protein n=1 Tax=Nocardia sp. NPDC056100 TaxID=3345712 RepID=UPI0035D9C62B
MMWAVVVDAPGPPEALRLAEIAEPTPGADELLIEVAYAGVGFVDTLFRSGVFALPAPSVPGLEVTGYVRGVGAGVRDFRVGQPVAALLNDFGRGHRAGGYAELAVAHSSMAVPLAADADLALTAAVLTNGVTAWLALHDLARVTPSDTVLVLGGGGVGAMTRWLAAISPVATVIAVRSSRSSSVDKPEAWIHMTAADRLEQTVSEVTAGRGVDVVIDAVGGELRTRAWELLAPFGRQVILGNASGADPVISTDSAWHGTRQLMGLSLGGVAHRIPERIGTVLTAVTDLVHRGILVQDGLAVVPLAEVAAVHRALEQRTAPPKTVLAVSRAGT